MSALRALWAEAVGLFVDDGMLAAMTLAWLAAALVLLPRLPARLGPALLFAGLVAILLESALRGARRK